MPAPYDFPSGVTGISAAYKSIKVTSHRPAIRANFEAGYEQTRSKFTRPIREWTITWDSMSKESFASLQYHFESGVTGGSESWIWNDPTGNRGSGATREVRYTDDSLSFDNIHQEWYRGSIKIREV